ncbi:lytic polysaccharide monooxygenase [Viridothelium virens]|uniref:Lytic polysaccharide monooxygenase n=1 Tax=Viridothelium virens TaxID=1048519 RepID=A0A6A6HCM9_VIRVR|nr:lytic polysaccharide monooxygenase [Viridothelium virens]
MKTATFASMLGFAVVTQAHMIMQNPTPITSNAVKDPLESSGANFPCHGQSLAPSGGAAWSVGSTQNLSFQVNTAVHGGGSCQVSITYETDAEKVKDPANWYVIHSIEGGCPAIAKGNLNSATECGSMGQTECVNSFPFELPKELKNGQATMAWTWSNTIGNREFYMDCAYVDVSGGSDQLGSLPNMYVGNLQDVAGSCTNKEESNVKYPQPGQYRLWL